MCWGYEAGLRGPRDHQGRFSWRAHNMRRGSIGLAVVHLLAAALVFTFFLTRHAAAAEKAAVLVDVTASYPGSSAEVVERQVTIPLEVALAGMRRLKQVHSQSLFGRARIRCHFEYGTPVDLARQ